MGIFVPNLVLIGRYLGIEMITTTSVTHIKRSHNHRHKLLVISSFRSEKARKKVSAQ